MKLTCKRTLVALATAALFSPMAYATNGYFSHGYGTKDKGMAGAGVALPQDSMSAATNPAGEVWVGSRMDLGAAVFSPKREYSVNGGPGSGATFPLAQGTVESDSNYFLIPHFARNWMINSDSSFAVAVYGNGGMNTDYSASAPCLQSGKSGTFCAGSAGVDLMQLFITPTYSRKINATSSWGISAILAAQRFKAKGLSSFAGFSSDSGNLSDRGYDTSYGGGVRIGWQGEVTPGLTLGASYTTKIRMSKFDKYKGLFAEQGRFDIPANATIGLAWKVTPSSVLAFDVQKIWYGNVDSIGNGNANLGTGNLGTDNGAGFGWRDMTVYKLGYQFQTSSDWTWRVGVSHGRQPIPQSQVLLNIIAPGVVETHITGGFTWNYKRNHEFNLSAMYAPSKTVSGPNQMSGNPPQTVDLKMSQYELEASWGWRF